MIDGLQREPSEKWTRNRATKQPNTSRVTTLGNSMIRGDIRTQFTLRAQGFSPPGSGYGRQSSAKQSEKLMIYLLHLDKKGNSDFYVQRSEGLPNGKSLQSTFSALILPVTIDS